MIVVDRRVARSSRRRVTPRRRWPSASPSVRGLPRRRLRALLGAGSAVHQPETAPLMKDIADEQRAMTLRMLIEGHSDPVERQAARRQPAHLRRLHRRPQGRVRGRDPVPARLHDRPSSGIPGRRGRRPTPRRTRAAERAMRTRAATEVTALVVRRAGGVALGPNKVGGELGPRLTSVEVCRISLVCRSSPTGVGLRRCADPEKAEAEAGGCQRDGHLACDRSLRPSNFDRLALNGHVIRVSRRACEDQPASPPDRLTFLHCIFCSARPACCRTRSSSSRRKAAERRCVGTRGHRGADTLAEAAGFEPARGLPSTRLAGGRHRPD